MESAALAFGAKRGTTQIAFRPPKARGMRLKIADDRRALREKALAFDACLDETDFPKFWSIFSLLLPTEGLAVSSKGILCPLLACLLNAQQIKIEETSGYAGERKALSRLRACSLLCEPLSDRIGRQWRFSNARSTRALARYGRSACGRAFTRATWQRASRRCHRPGAS